MIVFLLLAPVLFSLAASILCAAAFPLLRSRIGSLPPERQRTVLLQLAFAPLAAGLALTAVALIPSAAALVRPVLDHCILHATDGHPHLCFRHPVTEAAAPSAWLLVGAFLGGCSVVAVIQLARFAGAARVLRGLRRITSRREGTDASVFEARAPLAFTGGFLAHEIFLSTGLLDALSRDQLAVVLAHEHHHARRRDPLWRAAASIASSMHVPPVRQAILADLHLACERACDESAAKQSGDRAFVAQTVVHVTKLLEAHPAAVAGFGGNVTARVEALLADAPPEAPSWRVAVGWFASVALLLSLSEPLHHGIETVLAAFVR